MAAHWPDTEVPPLVQTFTTGLRTVSVPRPFGELASVVAAFPAGALYERHPHAGTRGEVGAASVLARSIPYGTTAHPSTASLAAAIEGIGGAFGVDAGDDLASVWASVPADQLEAAVAAVVEMATTPLLGDEAVARERQVMIGRLRSASSEPGAKSSELLGTLLWPSGALGRTFEGTIEAVGRLDRDTVRDFHGRQYGAASVVVGASAPLEAQQIAGVLRREVERWTPGEGLGPTEAGEPGGRFAYAPVQSELAYVALGALAVPVDHPDRYGLNLLAVALGGGMTSRLFKEVREKRGLCYGIGARLSLHRTAGSFSISAGVPPDRFEEAVAAILEQIRLSETELTESEVDRAKALVRGRLAMESDDAGRLTSRYVADVLQFDRVRLAREILGRIEPLTPRDLGTLAATYLAPDRLRLAVAGTFPAEPPTERVLG